MTEAPRHSEEPKPRQELSKKEPAPVKIGKWFGPFKGLKDAPWKRFEDLQVPFILEEYGPLEVIMMRDLNFNLSPREYDLRIFNAGSKPITVTLDDGEGKDWYITGHRVPLAICAELKNIPEELVKSLKDGHDQEWRVTDLKCVLELPYGRRFSDFSNVTAAHSGENFSYQQFFGGRWRGDDGKEYGIYFPDNDLNALRKVKMRFVKSKKKGF